MCKCNLIKPKIYYLLCILRRRFLSSFSTLIFYIYFFAIRNNTYSLNNGIYFYIHFFSFRLFWKTLFRGKKENKKPIPFVPGKQGGKFYNIYCNLYCLVSFFQFPFVGTFSVLLNFILIDSETLYLFNILLDKFFPLVLEDTLYVFLHR